MKMQSINDSIKSHDAMRSVVWQCIKDSLKMVLLVVAATFVMWGVAGLISLFSKRQFAFQLAVLSENSMLVTIMVFVGGLNILIPVFHLCSQYKWVYSLYENVVRVFIPIAVVTFFVSVVNVAFDIGDVTWISSIGLILIIAVMYALHSIYIFVLRRKKLKASSELYKPISAGWLVMGVLIVIVIGIYTYFVLMVPPK